MADEGTLPFGIEPMARRWLGDREFTSIEVSLQTITPIFGGGAETGKLDPVDIIRVPSLRGHLRFWWRALHGHQWKTSAELAKHEAKLWGGMAGTSSGRSLVEVRVKLENERQSDHSPVKDSTAYALWPARESPKQWKARCKPGLRFSLRVQLPQEFKTQVEHTLCAWILFGGYGGRTRRGCGSLTVTGPHASQWLPPSFDRQSLQDLLGDALFQKSLALRPLPLLAGASAHYCGALPRPEEAWRQALSWLREFRQGAPLNADAPPSGYARDYPENGDTTRPGRSHWPEADKVRRLSRPSRGNRWQHEPEHNATPSWPRAGFGLPIVGQFQTRSRDKGADGKLRPYRYDEPDPFELRWQGAAGEDHSRLASPLILKAVPLADGRRFIPVALWLDRAYPAGQVSLWRNQANVPHSEAPFDLLVAPGDIARFAPLAGHSSLRDAFFSWLETEKKARKL